MALNSTQTQVLSPWNPSVLVNGATATGVANSNVFAIPMVCRDNPRKVNYTAKGTYSVCTITLLQSMDGGTSWQAVGAAYDFFANPGGDLTVAFPKAAFTSGTLYQLSVTTITGTSITILAVCT